MRTQGFSEEIQMKRKILIGGIALPALAFCFACASSTEAQLGGPENKAPEQFAASNYVVSGPYSHKNLTIFLLHGADQRQDKTPLTLQEAMDRKMVVVHETGDVNNLAVENLSDEEVYVQSGDIVKGGRQDRVLALDLIVPPKSGKIQIASFCVEQGRWSGRGQEEAGQFASSRKALSSKDLKIAAKHSVSSQIERRSRRGGSRSGGFAGAACARSSGCGRRRGNGERQAGGAGGRIFSRVVALVLKSATLARERKPETGRRRLRQETLADHRRQERRHRLRLRDQRPDQQRRRLFIERALQKAMAEADRVERHRGGRGIRERQDLWPAAGRRGQGFSGGLGERKGGRERIDFARDLGQTRDREEPLLRDS